MPAAGWWFRFWPGQGARQLAIVIVSHAHADHLGGVPSVLDRFDAQVVLEPGERVADPLYYAFLDELAADAIRVARRPPG